METIKATLEYLTKLFQWWIIVQPWEKGIRTRFGENTKVLDAGCHFRLPFFDTVYIQESRLRVLHLPLQTITTKDGKTISVNCAIGYSIKNIETLYNKLFQVEGTISNMCLGEVSEYVSTHELLNCTPKEIEESINKKLNIEDYGISYEYFKIIGYAVVKTYRLIQDGNWMPNELSLTQKH